MVLKLRNAAEEQQEKLTEKQENANTALDMISNAMKDTNSHKDKIEHLKLQTEQENAQLAKRYVVVTFKSNRVIAKVRMILNAMQHIDISTYKTTHVDLHSGKKLSSRKIDGITVHVATCIDELSRTLNDLSTLINERYEICICLTSSQPVSLANSLLYYPYHLI